LNPSEAAKREIVDRGLGCRSPRLFSLSIFAAGRSCVSTASSFFSKEILQNYRRFILENTRTDIALMIERGMLKQIDDTTATAAPRVGASAHGQVPRPT